MVCRFVPIALAVFLSLTLSSFAIASAGPGDKKPAQPAAEKPDVKEFDVTPTTPQSTDLVKKEASETYTVYDTPAGQTSTFSGKIDGLGDYGGSGLNALVGIIYLKGIFWNRYDNYQWASVRPDGTFTITSDRFPDARKALVVQQPGRPWTFLRHDFNPGDSAKDIVMNIQDSTTVWVQAEDAQGRGPQNGFQVEVFDGVKYTEPGATVTYQRLGRFSTYTGPLRLDLPNEPVALYVAGEGFAPFYQIIDPSSAQEFVFRLLPEGIIKGTVTKGDKPDAGQTVTVNCAAVPLAARTATTGADGTFSVSGLPPGRYAVTVSGSKLVAAAVVKPGETTTADVSVDD